MTADTTPGTGIASALSWPARAAVRRGGPRLFAAPVDEPRARRAGDLFVLALSVLGLAATSAAAEPEPGFARAVARLIASVPAFVEGAAAIVADAWSLMAIAVLAAAVVRRRFAVGRDIVLAVALAAALWLILGRSVEGSWPAVWSAVRESGPPPWYPAPRVALPMAALLTVAPHLTLPLRRLLRWTMVLGVLAVAITGATTPLGAIAGVLVALAASSAVHLVFGSSAGRPSIAQVAAALDELGVEVSDLGAADRQQAGLFLLRATDVDGQPLTVKVYGRDAHDSALLTTLWRTVWYREAGTPLRLGRLQQVEHEALMTLFAAQTGVRTDTVVTAGLTAEEDAVLVLRGRGVALAEAEPRDVGLDADGLLVATWDLLRRLGHAGLAHGQVDDRHLVLDPPASDDRPAARLGLVDFRSAGLAATDVRLRTDEAQALVTTAQLAGTDAAVAAAHDALGDDGLAAVVPFLQLAALTPVQRSELEQRRRVARRDAQAAQAAGEMSPAIGTSAAPAAPDDRLVELSTLRAAAAARAGVEQPELYRLRRVTIGSIVRLVLPALAVFLIISGLAGVDFGELADDLRNAVWWLVVAGVVMSQVPRISQAVSTLGSSPVPVPLGPLYALQLALSYINVAVPSTAARVAVNIRFFQRQGVPPGAALAAGALDGFAGFVVQTSLLLGLITLTSASLDLDLGGAAGTVARVGLLVLAIVAASVAVILAVRRIRRFVFGWLRRLAVEALGALRSVRTPRKLLLLVGGNIATEVLFATALGVFTRALGFPIGLGELLLVNISVALLSGLVPIPGGVGVAEGGLAYGLVLAGMPDGAALSAVLMYRAASFYLPPLWGYFALRWLERRHFL